MRRLLTVIIIFGLFLGLSGCVNLDRLVQPTARVDNQAGAASLPPYSGSKARIAVASFDVKAAKAGGQIGSGLREMLTTSLMNSNRFRVVERQELGALMQEQELALSGMADTSSGGPVRGKIKTAELLITAAVTEFEPLASGGRAGIGGGGGKGSGFVGGLLGALDKAHMALDIRIIDSSTSEILAATRVEGSASKISAGFGVNLFIEHFNLGGSLSKYSRLHRI